MNPIDLGGHWVKGQGHRSQMFQNQFLKMNFSLYICTTYFWTD